MKHHPLLLYARGRHCCICSCGWSSVDYLTITGAHLAFGRHLLETKENVNVQ